jgi:hypothetical protein
MGAHLLARHQGVLVSRGTRTSLQDSEVFGERVCTHLLTKTPQLVSGEQVCLLTKTPRGLASRCVCSPRHRGVWQADVLTKTLRCSARRCVSSPRHQGVWQEGAHISACKTPRCLASRCTHTCLQDTEVSGKQVHTYLLARHQGVWQAGVHTPACKTPR